MCNYYVTIAGMKANNVNTIHYELFSKLCFYEIVFEKPGGLVMPIIAEIVYKDGTKEQKYYPAEIWRFNDKEIKKININPNKLTADVDLSNNNWPKKKRTQSDKYKKKKVSHKELIISYKEIILKSLYSTYYVLNITLKNYHFQNILTINVYI